ncbi:MAG: UDP-N-acetyl-D-mannosamine dehydrogenase [Chloroflexi bacterium]|nr:UDP-N-acetyl-D-mannosamine dehydrogenase [Chloroflexota bacterium]
MNRVCVIGLGYVGLPTAAVLASRGMEVVGVDIDPARVEVVNSGRSPFDEWGLDSLVANVVSAGTLTARGEPSLADAYIVAVPTPIRTNQSPDLSYVRAAVDSLAPALRRGNLVVVESTCPVGTTEEVCARLAASRRDLTFPHTAGEASDVHVAYCAERILPGNALEELIANDRIIGGVTPACAEAAKRLYEAFAEGVCHVTSVRTAELTKLAENAFRDVNVAFANELSLVCRSLGVDPWELVGLANRHPRVEILNPGPGVGGHCIPVDPWFIAAAAPDLTPLIQTARQVNDGMPKAIADRVIAECEGLDNPVVACLGLAYKANTADLRESPAIEVIKELQKRLKGRVVVVEPSVCKLPDEIAAHTNAKLVGIGEGLAASDVVVLLTDHDTFAEIGEESLVSKVVIDSRGMWDRTG